MSINIGIIGLPQSGKTTIFNALTRGKVDTASHTPEGSVPHVGITKIPEPRLQTLVDILHPTKIVPAEISYTDIGASVKGLAKDKGLGGELLNRLSSVDALIVVVRAFVNESIAHAEGSLDVKRDIAAMDLELVFSDLTIIERRLAKIDTSLKGAKADERHGFLREQETLMKFKADLERDLLIRDLALTPAEAKIIGNYQFLTAKPLLIIINISEDQLAQAKSLETELSLDYSPEKCRVIAFCGKLEMELVQLDNSAAREFRAEFGIEEAALERTIRLSHELLGFISFFTIASNEVRAWSIPAGTSALKAAGKIHSDMERGFIRAEIINHDGLIKCGSLAEARKQGLLRLEGKEYTVKDGDVITFLFNV